MNFSECLDFVNRIKNCAVATLEKDQPRVRMLGLWFADKTGFYFQAWTFKAIYQQLKENRKIEACFYGEDIMLRVAGRADFIEDKNLKEKVLLDRPFLKDLGATGPDDPKLIIFYIPHGEISFWGRKTGNKVEVVNF
jgi:pyridoxamine 5'-phosphate oxidase